MIDRKDDIKSLLPAEYRLMCGDTDVKLPRKRAASKRKSTPEGEVQKAILGYLKTRKDVAWYHRMNTGAVKIPGGYGGKSRFVRFGFTGCSDILGQMTDGRFLAIEVKSAVGKASPSQKQFIDQVNSNNGLAGMARSIDDVKELLDGHKQVLS